MPWVRGSPPRAWGRRSRGPRSRELSRITPTGVGTASVALPNAATHADHPHGRGDGGVRSERRGKWDGSPPRAWGRRHVESRRLPRGRITPTGVGTASRSWAPPSSCTDHPHGRGDGHEASSARTMARGSPPRAWGRPGGPSGRPCAGRITPTGVGTAISVETAGGPQPDHPHGRGDGEKALLVIQIASGSPPRAWGRRPRPARPRRFDRITPTGVGTATTIAGCRSRCTDHPHGRGDGDLRMRREPPWSGSPPRAWGRRRRDPVRVRCPGITPTGVGTAARRSCVPGPAAGSPPRAWGRLNLARLHRRTRRITPTGVGTATPPAARAPTQTDHPHGRGDGNATRSARPHADGSPPRAWGRRKAARPVEARMRITPTGVGTASRPRTWRRRPADHPHGRGDGRLRAEGEAAAIGSPPRAWGRPVRVGCIPFARRITPTGVGTAGPPARGCAAQSDHPHGRGDGTVTEPGSDAPARITPTGVGTATNAWPTACRSADHPHGRGDGPRIWRVTSPANGSPPRAWGRRQERSNGSASTRITPTGVGTASYTVSGDMRSPGSPPRAWGRLNDSLDVTAEVRITPTGVGTAYADVKGKRAATDHPHGRGDGWRATRRTKTRIGSPPRAWGRPEREMRSGQHHRITPTGVGTARTWPSALVPDRDHPHGRGDGRETCPTCAGGGGSPPRAWGRRVPDGR